MYNDCTEMNLNLIIYNLSIRYTVERIISAETQSSFMEFHGSVRWLLILLTNSLKHVHVLLYINRHDATNSTCTIIIL